MSKTNEFELGDFTPYLLNLAAETCSLEFQRYYKSRYGMLRTEWRVIFHLGRYGALTAKDICIRARIHKTKVSRAVAALEQKRFLKRETLETDRRHEQLTLTRSGKSAFEDLYEAARQFDHEITLQFSPGEKAILRKCLMRIAKLR